MANENERPPAGGRIAVIGGRRAPDPAALARLYRQPGASTNAETPLALPGDDTPPEAPDDETANEEE
jgi:hypothetical protein